MRIRSSSKALIVHEGRMLLNRLHHEDGRVYYDLPGGGQEPMESMEAALIREVREETGYTVRVKRLAGVAEEIFTDAALQKKYPDYCHRIIHLFGAELTDLPRIPVSDADMGMEASVWVALDELDSLPEIVPSSLKAQLPSLLSGEVPVYLGTVYYDWQTP